MTGRPGIAGPTRCRRAAFAVLIALVALGSARARLHAESAARTVGPRPAQWAEPLAGTPGVGNLYRVADGLYRGAQPNDAGFEALRRLGIRSVVNLRRVSDPDSCRRRGLECHDVPMSPRAPRREQLVEFLRIATDPGRQPVFVHCKLGADRTGLMVAVYRIVVQGWSKDEAIAEMKDGGYGFHAGWFALEAYVRSLDVEGLLETDPEIPHGDRDGTATKLRPCRTGPRTRT